MAPSPEDEGFLSRWSQRKRAARTEDAQPAEPEADAADEAQPEEEIRGPEPITEEELAALPPVEDLTADSDIRGFLRPGVPNALKNAARRRMWMLTPAIRDHADPAVDYAWDWNTPGGVPGDGVAPTRDVARRMLDELLAPRRESEPPEAREPVQTAAKTVEGAETAQESPETHAAAPDLPGEEKTDDSGQDEVSSGRRPRHGGALPG